MAIGRTIFKLGYEISPIILTGGIASLIPGGMLPIVAITEAGALLFRLLQGDTQSLSLDQFFAHFVPVAGSTLANNAVGNYPFANQVVAANAMVAQPLNVSLRMHCPVKRAGGYTNKLITLTALKSTLDAHTARGGTYTVATPGYIYTDCLLLSLRDISGEESKQKQVVWQWDFQRPLLALNEAAQAYSSLMDKVASGVPTGAQPSWSGPLTTAGDTLSGAGASVVDSAKNLAGSAVSSAQNGIQSFTQGS